MSFYRFKDEDIIDTEIATYPHYRVSNNGNQITGSVYLDRPSLQSGINTRLFEGFSLKHGAIMQKNAPFTSSIELMNVVNGGLNKEMYQTIQSMYDFYSFFDPNYTSDFTGSTTNVFRVLSVPEIYFDSQIATGSLVMTDMDTAGKLRTVYDNGRGGIYSGSVSGTLVGNIFYSEGIIVLKGGGFNDNVTPNEFGATGGGGNYFWTVEFEGQNKIPVKIFRCRAPAGQLNASSNPTFYHVPSGSLENHRYEREIVLDESATYITAIGIYNEHYELVGLAKLAQPIKKAEAADILFRLRLDF
jgi:hypothetical protein